MPDFGVFARVPRRLTLFWRGHAKTMLRVPFEARDSFAACLVKTLNAVDSPSPQVSDRSWVAWQLLPRLLLRRPLRRSKLQNIGSTFARLVQQRRNRYLSGDYITLLLDARVSLGAGGEEDHPAAAARSRAPKRQTDDSRIARAVEEVRDGSVRRATAALSQESVAPLSNEVFAELSRKHPDFGDRAVPNAPAPDTCCELEMESLVFALGRCRSTASSSTGWRATQLPWLRHPSSDTRKAAREAILRLARRIATGDITDIMRVSLCAARIFALRKKTGGVRPIVIQDVFRRLSASCVAKSEARSISEACGAAQFAVGKAGGAAAYVLSARLFLERPDAVALGAIDVHNAFNNVKRSLLFRAVAELAPFLLGYVVAFYGKRSPLFTGSSRAEWFIVWAADGVAQGDPLATALFALCLAFLLRAVQPPALVHSVAYADNVHVLVRNGADPAAFAEYMHCVRSTLADAGLLLNPDETLFLPAHGLTLASKFVDIGEDAVVRAAHLRPNGIMLLGAPVGCDAFVIDHLEQHLARAADLLRRVRVMARDCPQECLLILRLAITQTTGHLERSVPPRLLVDFLASFDKWLTRTVEELLVTTSLEESVARLISLPVRHGGLGLRCRSEVAPCVCRRSI